jgi:hypothetical protein
MICGVPVVASAVNAVSDLVIPGQTGLLVPPNRPGLLAAAIGHLLDSPGAAAGLATAAHARLADRHGQAELRAALLAAYSPALAEAVLPPAAVPPAPVLSPAAVLPPAAAPPPAAFRLVTSAVPTAGAANGPGRR